MTDANRELDRCMMLRAITLAKRGQGRVEPNPLVGCIIARDGRILGEGFHRRFGGLHAEVIALNACTTRTVGATAYVTLEPCCHHGKTPPCTDALIRSGVKRVVVALRDPNPLVNGGGITRLRRAGICVDVGTCADEAAEVLAPFLTRMMYGRPYVIAKWAQSLDGKLATPRGESQWISGDRSRAVVHRLRARVDAILVGIGTVLRDDPQLTARNVTLRRVARRVVLDTRLRLPLNCNLVRTAGDTPTVVLTSRDGADTPKAARLRKSGVIIHAVRTGGGGLSLRDSLRRLAHDDVTNLLVEGGPNVLSRFLGDRLVDEAWIFVAPMLIGSRGAPGPFDESRIRRLDHALRPRTMQTRRVGDDLFHRLRLTDPPGVTGA